jgi:Asp-tRNA(Asn)/Glu-tRNA(Gln) amidotransferase A subunit family amidase
MTFDPYRPLTELVDCIASKQVSPVELLRAYLDRIERHNGALNAIVTLHADRALEAARVLERRLVAGEDVGPLAGVPFVAKDLEDGAHADDVRIAPVQRQRRHAPTRPGRTPCAAGAYPIGKSNTPEFARARGMQTSNALSRCDPQPLASERTPGGSSGGAAAALVAPVPSSPPDGGGSIRHPAAFTGCVGLKLDLPGACQRPDLC